MRKVYWLFKQAVDILSEKGAPDWMLDHPEIAKRKEVSKIFPKIGIPNFREEVSFVQDKSEDEELVYAADNLSKYLVSLLEKYENYLNDLIREKPILVLPDEEAAYLKKLLLFVQDSQIAIIEGNRELPGLAKINMNVNFGGKKMLSAGQSFFKIFDRNKELVESFGTKYGRPAPTLSYIEKKVPGAKKELGPFALFNLANMPNRKYYVAFASEGPGAWDIATMSMRGIRSCQSWDDSRNYKTCLIGSIISNYVGIVYLTSGTPFGSAGEKMMFRCVVRYAVDYDTGKSFVVLDKMYPNLSEKVYDLFLKVLQSKSQVPVISAEKIHMSGTTEERRQLRSLKIPGDDEAASLPREYRTYQDKGIDLEYPEDYAIRIARDAATSKEKLSELSRNESETVRTLVAKNPSTSPETLKYLSNERSIYVLEGLAENPNSSESILLNLVKNRNGRLYLPVSYAAAQNHSSTPPVLLAILENPEALQDFSLLRDILNHPSTNKQVLERLSQSDDEYISQESKRRLNEL